ncbi:hypothetical protein D6764_05120 [Candidatus Woesearchaeota archaeon]|nr:MAG: hypothetical protein D6764_05120 [Candidatus Woesearchaeota archaeon]
MKAGNLSVIAFIVLFATLIVGVSILAGDLIGDALNSPKSHEKAPVEYVTVVMEKKPEAKAVFEEESVYAKMREMQKKKIERNRELVPVIEEKEKEKEEYIKRRKNWVRYIDGELIRGYDPRYDRAFDTDSIHVEYKG